MLFRVLIPLIIIVLMAGCSPQKEQIEVLSAKDSTYELYLYTKKDQKKEAGNYLNALLDWQVNKLGKQTFDFKQSTTQSDRVKIETNKLPALVIKKEGEIVKLIQGHHPSTNIVSELEDHVLLSRK